MLAFLLGLVLGAIVVFLGPSLLPQQFRNAFLDNALRIIGVFAILFAIASTSFVRVPDGYLGQLFRVYGGGSLTEGRIVAVHGENGPQAKILTPGFHPWFLVNVLYDVDTSKPEVSIPKGKVGTLTAKDGMSLRPGQAFADPFPASFGYKMLDAEVFLLNGGQRGPQLSVLTPGKYRLNRYLWDIAEVDAREVKAGFVGVIKSNVHADLDLGTLKADKPGKCDPLSFGRPDEKGQTRRAGGPGRLRWGMGQVSAAGAILFQSGGICPHRNRHASASVDLCRWLPPGEHFAHGRCQGRHRPEPH